MRWLKGTSARPRVSLAFRHALTTGAASAPRRSKSGAEEKEKKTHPLSQVCGARPFRPYVRPDSLTGCQPWSGHTDGGTRRWRRRDEDVAHLRRAACRAFNAGPILDSMHLQFITSDELAPVVDSNSSRDSTGGMEDTLKKKKKKKMCLMCKRSSEVNHYYSENKRLYLMVQVFGSTMKSYSKPPTFRHAVPHMSFGDLWQFFLYFPKS